jgi:hypothetical protein
LFIHGRSFAHRPRRSGSGEVPRVRLAKAFLVDLFERERSLFEGT